MHCCEFCSATYQPRPQVKRPRACPQCQKQRQRANEKAWHFKHQAKFDPSYFSVKRELRLKEVRKLVEEFLKCFLVGLTFSGKRPGDEGLLRDYFQRFFLELGIRRVNKLWAAT
jgi:hypothetical protein